MASSNNPNQQYAEQAQQQLSWLNAADAKKDSAAALSAKDYRLWAYSGRVPNIPGVNLGLAGQSIPELEKKCGLRYMDGVSDVVFSDEHMAMLKKAYDYAEAYNRIMLAHCQ